MVKNLPAKQETWVWSLGWEDPLEEGMSTHSSMLAWRILWKEEPGGLQSVGSQRVSHDWVTNTTTGGSVVKSLPAKQESWVWSLGWEDPLEKEMVTHSSILAWRIPWTEKPGRLHRSTGSQRVGHDWATSLSLSDGKESAWNWGLIPGSGRSPGEGNGYPLQNSCLENPMDRGAW